jgi:hypothetical protein
LVLLSLPLLVWWLHRQQQHLQRIVGTLLDQLAEACGLRILPGRDDGPSAPADTRADSQAG